ncbi:MAG: hypothetical protein A3A43_00475 [Candidatus Liptonbacteria bacterium RIFCSPLOWO2_01_FULL_56_20]|uniref:Uncharacterized protein n=1 Tax=Candidatus Liptonbacteria bacterium RIFCSPLOWO2_01_FULL_56_20 TaxID=1798652 RepID=A0A1G2CI70_9BACT|nr:MAG: hypothetical protein A2681_02860 [Candidatus Liptonbacteria bacterium RIFCSPHIGHO2_01_FULL_56_18b]OGZ01103.1 MAG: hypothetical protein A3A43_00475 [Candidatus Liptonbacteria bacterium RIFCSPLOWO2_01_FULL_56_20]
MASYAETNREQVNSQQQRHDLRVRPLSLFDFFLIFSYNAFVFALRILNWLPPKKNWKLLNLAAKPLRIRGGFLAACGGEMRSD